MSKTSPQHTIGKIPVKNLWLLMLYASALAKHVLRDTPPKKQDYEKNPEDILNLVAEILTSAVERRLRRNITVELDRTRSDLTRVRGRIDHIRTERAHLLQHGMVACIFDEFTTDTPKNRLVRRALDKLSQTHSLGAEWKRRCRSDSLALEKAGVGRNATGLGSNSRAGWTPSSIAMRSPEDWMMLAAAELALNLRIPAEKDGHAYLDALDRTNHDWIRNLFERAVAGFYHAKFPEWSVNHGDKIKWQKESPTKGIAQIFPDMTTDITIERTDLHTNTRSRIIIDTKFTEITTASQYKSHILKSGHIYQLYTYLRSQERKNDEPSCRTSGMLLYPSVDGDVDESVTIQNHKFRFATVDLSKDSTSIRNRLMHLIQS